MDHARLSFEDWLATLDPDGELDDRHDWLRRKFDVLGPVDARTIDEAYELELANALRSAIEIVRADLPNDPTGVLEFIHEPGRRGIAYGQSETYSSPMTF